uniref:AlNc14C223G9146 protein n=1 Tax=Albugo laibachii Nc14 TaxID=890382 RepID=F0WS03_9STRA|nr:AlNc14C223G9146 [Albugo laibachii Nc14]|eukprot:CCA24121.1 AlNc14C223G9146 [Albugo laibachii Nc14]
MSGDGFLHKETFSTNNSRLVEAILFTCRLRCLASETSSLRLCAPNTSIDEMLLIYLIQSCILFIHGILKATRPWFWNEGYGIGLDQLAWSQKLQSVSKLSSIRSAPSLILADCHCISTFVWHFE